MREILLEMYEQLWEADKDKFAWNAILKDTLEKIDVVQQEPNEALMKAAEKHKARECQHKGKYTYNKETFECHKCGLIVLNEYRFNTPEQ